MPELALRIKEVTPGRIVGLLDRQLYIGRNYDLYIHHPGQPEVLAARLPRPFKRRVIEPSRLLCRLLRHEIRAAFTFPDQSKIVATRQGLYYGRPDETLLTAAHLPVLTPALKLPMTFTVDRQQRILWGEYWGNPELRAVRLFVSQDRGISYEPFYSFKPGEIKHVHNIIEDPHQDCFWVLVGDHFEQSGIGRLSKDLKHFDWLVKGQQKYRAVCAFVFPGHLIYATDSEKEPNHLYQLDIANGQLEQICSLPGSCIYAARFGKWYAVSTTSEYFSYKTPGGKYATLWVSKDTQNWQQVFTAEKDIWNKKYFQFGSIVLPRGQWDSDTIVFSGQAVKKYDNVTCSAEIIEN